ncbi:MAG: heavy metal sensor histidine kinase [Gammaproteobacteria bacterium]
MCWKTMNIRKSMTMRLVSIYAATSFALLLILVVSLYLTFTKELETEDKQFLADTISVVQSEFKELKGNRDPDFLKDEFMIEPSIYHYYLRLIDANGKVIIETPNMTELVPVSRYHEAIDQQAFKMIISNKHYLLMHSKQNINGEDLDIQIAMDVSSGKKILERHKRDLIRTLLIGVVVSAIAAVIVTRRGLRPLSEMTEAVKRITISQPNERIDSDACPQELSQLATAFNHMLNRIEEGYSRLSQFSGDLAHELRIPIANLMGEAEIAISRKRTPEEYQQVIGSSLEELQRLSKLIENLLFLARAEDPKSAITFSTVDVGSIFKDICDYYGIVAEEQGIALVTTGTSTLKGDLAMLRQVISNLVSNALRYTPKGGSITLSTLTRPNGTVEISVKDTGKGIAAEHLPFLFDRFYRVDADRAQMTGGTGLGLAIVKSIVDLHQGSISIDSEPGKGTTVTLIFPV